MVWHQLPKLRNAGSNPVFRSRKSKTNIRDSHPLRGRGGQEDCAPGHWQTLFAERIPSFAPTRQYKLIGLNFGRLQSYTTLPLYCLVSDQTKSHYTSLRWRFVATFLIWYFTFTTYYNAIPLLK